MSDEQVKHIQELVAAYGDGQPGAIESLIAAEFYNYVPGPDEPNATEVTSRYAAELKAAAPDLRVEIPDLTQGADGRLSGEAIVSGTWIGELWGAAPSGERYTFRIPITLRPVGDRFAVNVELDTPGTLAILRELQLVNPADQMHLPPPHPVVFDDFMVKLLFTGQAADKPCTHLEQVKVTQSDATLCDDCEPGEIWPALRLCLICGHVGCCDTSTYKHAKAHWEQTGHPLIRSLRMDEAWMWCYEDNAVFERRTLERIQARLEAA